MGSIPLRIAAGVVGLVLLGQAYGCQAEVRIKSVRFENCVGATNPQTVAGCRALGDRNLDGYLDGSEPGP